MVLCWGQLICYKDLDFLRVFIVTLFVLFCLVLGGYEIVIDK